MIGDNNDLQNTIQMLDTLQKGIANGKKTTKEDLEKTKVIALLEIGRQLAIGNFVESGFELED